MNRLNEEGQRDAEDDSLMSPETRRYYRETFRPQHREMLLRINEVALSVLIWDAHASSSLHEARLSLRNRLRTEGFSAFFDEEAAEPLTGKHSESNQLVAQIAAVDLVVAIVGVADSPAGMAKFRRILAPLGGNVLIYIDKRLNLDPIDSNALKELQSRYSCVNTFSYPEDIETGSLIETVTRQVKRLREAKWILERRA